MDVICQCAQRLSASTEKTPASVGSPYVPIAGAQRLSASTEKTLAWFAGISFVEHWCSTPFGINGKDTASVPFVRFHVCVLNAFRHQRKRHCCIRCESQSSSGAQRLSASTEKTLSGPSGLPSPLCVLNAFRHQRKRHFAWFWFLCGIRCVLNAFRHQRKRHPKQSRKPILAGWCSTPFGINGKDTALVPIPC